MKRRDLLILAGGVSVWPKAVLSQASRQRVPLIGYLVGANLRQVLMLFRKGLQELGYVEGKNLELESRSAEGKAERLSGLAAELVRLKVDVLVVSQTPAATAAKQATSEIPIVMAGVGDPVGTGLVRSLARPGGNITGVSGLGTEIAGKALQVIREVIPSMKKAGMLANADDPFTKPYLANTQEAARRLSLEIVPAMIRSPAEIEPALADFQKQKVDVVIVQPSLPRRAAAELALRYRLPTFGPTSQFPGEGGLLSYSANQADLQRVAATYVDRILKGAKPADLPVQQAAVFDLAVNIKTAKALGITVPASVLVRADRVIE
jgi:putative ABC transport system substrate-binding protein